MQLLVSVMDAREARAALAGGADVIDAKDPRRGSLGPVRLGRLREIRAAVGGARPVCAALGDARDPVTLAHAVRAATAGGLGYLKVGFREVATQRTVEVLAGAARGAMDRAARLILVAYADWPRAASLPPGGVLAAAVAAGAAGVLVDTACKDEGLLERWHARDLAAWVEAVHRAGLLAAVAGGLRPADLHTVRAVGADIAGVRGAACEGGRTGRVSRARVGALSAAVGAAPLAHAGAAV